MRILVLEDQKESKDALLRILGEISPSIQVIGVSCIEKAREYLARKERIDLFLLDVNLIEHDKEDVSGITFAMEIREQIRYEFTPIVMITSVPGMEMEAYRKIHCYQYILKPFERREVEAVVKKVMMHTKAEEGKYIVIKKDGINYKVPIREIVYIRAVPRGICIYMKKDSMEVKYVSIKQILEKLPKEEFLQCHRMFVVHKPYIEYYDLVNRIIKMKYCSEMIDIGVTYKEEIRGQMDD